jgi:hypothetical protein
MREARRADVARVFGEEFAAALAALDAGEWHGPIDSPYGAHLVLLERGSAGGTPRFDDVREALRRDWCERRRRDARHRFYGDVLKRYVVTVEGDAGAAALGPAAAEARNSQEAD